MFVVHSSGAACSPRPKWLVPEGALQAKPKSSGIHSDEQRPPWPDGTLVSGFFIPLLCLGPGRRPARPHRRTGNCPLSSREATPTAGLAALSPPIVCFPSGSGLVLKSARRVRGSSGGDREAPGVWGWSQDTWLILRSSNVDSGVPVS